ncbi:putrescine/ornithine antiporter PotE [Photobacterium aphoticum]|uniref:Putrescine/ornithine antiporter PotE n=1 Tax=Photobacterium aphoticum TaxID=754436 RepID=A0A090QMG4_9GAMM|nr:putrescine/ornithine antiporter PotE [Photobacterium aphoticum]
MAQSTAPFGLVFSHMFNPTVGNIVTMAAVVACVGSLLGWQFTNAQVSKAAADEGLFPKVFAKTNKAGAPIFGMLIMLAAELLLAMMTISPNLVNQFNALLNLAVFVNMVPYILSMTGLEVMLRKNKVTPAQYKLGATVGTLGVVYSIYGVYACGADAVFGGTILTLFGYIFYGFLAARDVTDEASNDKEVNA